VDAKEPYHNLQYFEPVAEKKRARNPRDEKKIDPPKRGSRPAERQKDLWRYVDAGRAAPRFEILGEGLHALDDADGREREEGAAQAQDTEAEHKRERAYADAGGKQARCKRPMMLVNEPDADIAAEAEEHDAAEIDIAGIAQHQIEIAGERDVDGGQRQALAQLHVVADERRYDKNRDHQRNDPEERAAEDFHALTTLRAARKLRRGTRSALG